MGTTDSSLTNDPQSTPDADPVFVCTVCGTMDGNEWWGKPGVVLICGACLTAKRDAVSDPCPQCYGTGRYSDTSRSADTWRTRPCETCGGTGRVAKTATAQDFTALRQEVADQLAGIAERQAVPHFYGGDPTRPVASALTWQTQVAGARAADMSGCTAGAQGNCHRQRRRLTGEQCRQMARDLAEIGGAI